MAPLLHDFFARSFQFYFLGLAWITLAAGALAAGFRRIEALAAGLLLVFAGVVFRNGIEHGPDDRSHAARRRDVVRNRRPPEQLRRFFAGRALVRNCRRYEVSGIDARPARFSAGGAGDLVREAAVPPESVERFRGCGRGRKPLLYRKLDHLRQSGVSGANRHRKLESV